MMKVKRDIESATIMQSASMSTYALCSNDSSDMTSTIVTLSAYRKNLKAVSDTVLKPFAKQAEKFVTATIKYLKTRSYTNLENATKHRDELSKMMAEHVAKLKGGV